MNIVRGHIPEIDGHFTLIPNAWVCDPKLSYSARGLLAYLVTHGENWHEVLSSMLAHDPDPELVQAADELQRTGYVS